MTDGSPLTIVYRKTAELVPYARNARTHSTKQVAQIAASIREFGFTNPVLIDDQDGLIAGHGRVEAANLLKLDEVPTICLTGLSESKKRALILADNKLALNAGWDEEMLNVELSDLLAEGFDLELTGFGGDELAKLLSGANANLMDPTDGEGQTAGKNSPVLVWGNHRIPMDDDEIAWLDKVLKQHTDKMGVGFGFVREALANGDIRS